MKNTSASDTYTSAFDTMCQKRLCFSQFFMCRRIGEYISHLLSYRIPGGYRERSRLYTWRLQRMKQTSYRTPDGYRGWSRRLSVHLMVTEDEADVLPYTWRLQRMMQTSYRIPSWHRRLRESRESEECNPQTGSSRPAETRTCLPVTQSVRCWARNPATVLTRFWSDHHVVYCVDWWNRGFRSEL